MKKIIYLVIIGIALIWLGGFATANMDDFAQAEGIINQKIQCNELSDRQLEVLGDYYMEQMHPGELHEIMDERMGGDGSESLRQVHINMGRIFYCGQSGAMSVGMMNNMMGRGMMGYYGNNYYNTFYSVFILILFALIVFILILLIVYLVKKQGEKNGKRKNH